MASEHRLIDANAPLKQISDYMEKLHCPDDYLEGLYRGMEIAESYIKNAPTVDAEEVVHGRWKNKQTNSIFTWHLECSVCGADYNTSVGYNYCPNCGAKMDGGNEDGE